MWFKHSLLAAYSMIFILGVTFSQAFHLLVGYCRVMLYLCVHRRTMLVVIQVR